MPKTLRTGKLTVGEHVLQAWDGDENLIVRDFWINNRGDINRLEELGVQRVTIQEETKEDTSKPPTQQKAPSPEELEVKLDEAQHLVEESKTLYKHSVTKIKDIFFSADRDEDINPDELLPFVEKVMNYADQAAGSVAVLTQIVDYDFDTFRHSVNLGILSILFARHRNYNDDEIAELAYGAMLHDIGKIRIPEEIVLKEGELNDKEYEIIKTHATRGHKILKEIGIDDPIARIAHEHHERPNASGYPEGTDQIHPYSRIVSVLDVYDAMTSHRVYSDETKPNKAFSALRTEFGDYEETKSILYDLLRCLGIYPIGSLVQLTDGELGFVHENNTDDLKHPVVCVVVDDSGEELEQPFLLNLSRIQDHKTMKNEKFYDYNTEIADVLSLGEIPRLDSDDMFTNLGEIGF